jgi:hypothetical protein
LWCARVRNGLARRAKIKIEGLNTMSDFQTSTRPSDYRRNNNAHLIAVGDGVKRARLSAQVERHELLYEAAIITLAFFICVTAVCVVAGPLLPSLADAAPMANWPPGSN